MSSSLRRGAPVRHFLLPTPVVGVSFIVPPPRRFRAVVALYGCAAFTQVFGEMYHMQTLVAVLGAIALAPSTGPSGAVSPNTVTPGSPVTFSVVCAEGVREADVAGTALGLPERIPMEAGKAAGVFSVTVTIPQDTQEGTFNVSLDCADGTSSVVQLVVSPAGGVPTGGGAMSRPPNHTLMAAGGGLLVIGAAGALWLRRRPV